MARSYYGRTAGKRRSASSRRKSTGRTGRAGGFTARPRSRAKRSAAGGREVRIVIEQVAASPISRPVEGLMRTVAKAVAPTNRKAKF